MSTGHGVLSIVMASPRGLKLKSALTKLSAEKENKMRWSSNGNMQNLEREEGYKPLTMWPLWTQLVANLFIAGFNIYRESFIWASINVAVGVGAILLARHLHRKYVGRMALFKLTGKNPNVRTGGGDFFDYGRH
jgi:hypothetical protein